MLLFIHAFPRVMFTFRCRILDQLQLRQSSTQCGSVPKFRCWLVKKGPWRSWESFSNATDSTSMGPGPWLLQEQETLTPIFSLAIILAGRFLACCWEISSSFKAALSHFFLLDCELISILLHIVWSKSLHKAWQNTHGGILAYFPSFSEWLNQHITQQYHQQ